MRMSKLRLCVFMAAAVCAVICIGALSESSVHAVTAPDVEAEMRNPGGEKPYIRFEWKSGNSEGKGWELSRSVNGGAFSYYKTVSKDSGVEKYENIHHGNRYAYRITSKKDSSVFAVSDTVTAVMIPETPQSLKATTNAENPNTVTLTWTQQRDRYPAQFDSMANGPQAVIERRKGSGSYQSVTTLPDKGSFTERWLEYNTQYSYRVKFRNSHAESSASEVTVTTGSKPVPAKPSPTPTNKTSTVKKPELESVTASPKGPGVATIHVRTSTDYSSCYLEFYRNGAFHKQVHMQTYSNSFDVPVTYAGVTTYTVKCYIMDGGQKVYGNEMSVKATSGRMGTVRLTCTKISPRVFSLKWHGATGPSGYYVYAGKKLIKKTSKTQLKYKKKGGKKSFRVVPYVNIDGKRYTGLSSNKAKPKPNMARFSKSTYYKNYSYATCPFVIKKVSLKGKTYTIIGYAVNNRIFKMKKYHRLQIRVTSSGKTAFSKTWRNLSVNAGSSSAKRVVLKVRGKAGMDLHADCHYYAHWEPIW